jgi:drug/metabolite transporter (DMT)-like permease
MDPTIVVIVLASAALHPLWNAAVKDDDRPEGAFIGLVVFLMAIAGTHSLIAGYDLTTIVDVWPLLALSCVGQLLYGTSLVMTFRRGELSAYYPIVRSSPLFIVFVGVLFLDQTYLLPILFGIAMVLFGAFALQYRPGFRLLDDPMALFFAVLAMCGTGIYSMADARAVQVVEPPVMLFWVEVFALPSYLIMFRLYRVSIPGWGSVFYWARRPLRAAAIGAAAYTSYILILVAYSSGGEVAAVTSIRQASIPLSVLIGGLLLSEGRMWGRLMASTVLAAGIVVIVQSG